LSPYDIINYIIWKIHCKGYYTNESKVSNDGYLDEFFTKEQLLAIDEIIMFYRRKISRTRTNYKEKFEDVYTFVFENFKEQEKSRS
jgi:hypothetical protein